METPSSMAHSLACGIGLQRSYIYCMTFTDYSAQALKLDRVPDGPLWYPALGLAGETGEVIEHVKKFERDGKQPLKQDWLGEVGDVLWYLDAVVQRGNKAFGFDITLEEAARYNIYKLQTRSSLGKEAGEKWLEENWQNWDRWRKL